MCSHPRGDTWGSKLSSIGPVLFKNLMAAPNRPPPAVIEETGNPVLKRITRKDPSPSTKVLENAIRERMPERHILDVLCNVQHYTHWSRHFGPLSGSDPKLEDALERYVITAFAYGCNLGPAQTARPMRSQITPHQIAFVTRRHGDRPEAKPSDCRRHQSIPSMGSAQNLGGWIGCRSGWHQVRPV